MRTQLAAQRGGADAVFDEEGHRTGGARMTAVVALKPGQTGRHYRLPTDRDYEAVHKAQALVAQILEKWECGGKQGLCPVPDEPTPAGGGSGAGRAFSLQRYGMLQWGDLFTARQKVALHVIANKTAVMKRDATNASVLTIGKLLDLGNALCEWMPGQECPSAVFKLGRVKASWDFVEGCPLGRSSGSFEKCTDNLVAGVVSTHSVGSKPGQAVQAMAQKSPVPDESADVWFTDPPYYDAIPYADLADFFLVWMKRILPKHALLCDPFAQTNLLSPKDQEAVQDDARLVDGRPKDASFFDAVMGEAFSAGGRTLRADGIGAVVFAHKTTEGWEALLAGMIQGGWTITGSWPIATEMGHRDYGLAIRPPSPPVSTSSADRGPRMPWSATGPIFCASFPAAWATGWSACKAMASAVPTSSLPASARRSRSSAATRRSRRPMGEMIALAEYLAKVWEVVGRSALEQVLGTAEAKARNGAAGAVEEDARLTALFLWTLQSTAGETAEAAPDEDEDPIDEDDEDDSSRRKTKGFTLVFDVVRRFAQPLGIDLDTWKGRVIETKKGVVRLLPIAERATQLFGEDGAQAVAARLEQEGAVGTHSLQRMLFPDMEAAPKVRGRGRGHGRLRGVQVSDESLSAAREATTLDRVHAAMLLQSGGRTNALRALLKAEQERGPDFLRLANAFSALYPKGSEEKRLIDAMLLAVPR